MALATGHVGMSTDTRSGTVLLAACPPSERASSPTAPLCLLAHASAVPAPTLQRIKTHFRFKRMNALMTSSPAFPCHEGGLDATGQAFGRIRPVRSVSVDPELDLGPSPSGHSLCRGESGGSAVVPFPVQRPGGVNLKLSN